MIVDETIKKATKKEVEQMYTKEGSTSRLAGLIGQLNVYDSPERRIALYKMFGDKDVVQKVITSYPFKGFIGEMKLYDDFVAKGETKVEE